MDILQTANERMEQLAALMNKDIEQKIPAGEKVKVGVDLGTSSIVFVVLDENNVPLLVRLNLQMQFAMDLLSITASLSRL